MLFAGSKNWRTLFNLKFYTFFAANALQSANIVRKIFEMYHSGLGTFQIAVALTEEKVLTPSEYAKKKGIKKPEEHPVRRIQIRIIGDSLLLLKS